MTLCAVHVCDECHRSSAKLEAEEAATAEERMRQQALARERREAEFAREQARVREAVRAHEKALRQRAQEEAQQAEDEARRVLEEIEEMKCSDRERGMRRKLTLTASAAWEDRRRQQEAEVIDAQRRERFEKREAKRLLVDNYLLKNGYAHVNAKKSRWMFGSWYPVHAAIRLRDATLVAALVDARADLNLKDGARNTPLRLAMQLNSEERDYREVILALGGSARPQMA